jgi:hypothetical protein
MFMGCMMEKQTWHSLCLAKRFGFFLSEIWSLRTHTGLQKILCHSMTLKLACGVLWLQLGLLGPPFFLRDHEFTLICYTHSDTIFNTCQITREPTPFFLATLQPLTPQTIPCIV